MKKTQLWISMLIAIIFAIGSRCQASARDFDMFVYLVRGPLKSDPAYWSWSTNMVWKLYANRTLVDQDIGYRLTPDLVSEDSVMTNQTVWCVVRVTSRNLLSMCSLDQLVFNQSSSDVSASFPRGSLTNTYDIRPMTNAIYNDRALGVIWGIGGQRVSDTILDQNNPGTTPVNEVIFIGMQSVFYYPYSASSIQSYFDSFMNGFYMTMNCSVMGADGTTLVLGQRTLQTKGAPMQPVLSVRSVDANALIGSNMETNRTALIYSTQYPESPQWSFETSINAGELLVYPKNTDQMFFRAVLEPGDL